eukprot:TRINITY_DN2343_c0_g1_i1.p1 TRINITY_DN2343_c0_g1~~TRINITY_DN2343_c0_g1_i1.p1  ORF type:complete len:363 (+),score=113.70 TRINITY_DN2343_c0_g1_i1:229-1317(+)
MIEENKIEINNNPEITSVKENLENLNLESKEEKVDEPKIEEKQNIETEKKNTEPEKTDIEKQLGDKNAWQNIKFRELVFYDIETTIPCTDVIEFGAIVLNKIGFIELEKYNTLIKSTNISKKSIECNGITENMVENAPTFEQVADTIFRILNNRIWVGHNITTFDNKHIKIAFEKIGREAPKPVMIIDTLTLLKKLWGKRCGNMKMESLGRYFGLGQEKHRALEDCEMTVEVMKKVALTLCFEEEYGDLDKSISNIVLPKVEKKSYEKKTPEKIDPVQLSKIRLVVSQAIDEKKNLKIIYNGGKTPGEPRIIMPTRFNDKNDDQLHAKTFNSEREYTYSLSKFISYEITEDKVVNNTNEDEY